MSWRGFSLTVLSFVFTLLSTSAILVIGPGAFASRALTAVLLCPLIWALAMLYVYWDLSPRRPTAVLATGCVIGAAIVMLVEVEV